MIDRLTEDKIKDAARIVDVVGDFLELKKKGVEYTALCPFHEDKNLGNFMVSPKRNMSKCFACEWGGDPIKFLMEYGNGMTYKEALMYLAKKYAIPCEDAKEYNYTPAPPRTPVPQLPMLELPKYLMARTLTKEAVESDTLVKWIRTGIAWDTIQRKRIDEVLGRYAVGHSKQGMTVFWLMDEQARLRTGKMMRYRDDGHRCKDKGYNRDWIHSALCRKRNESDPWPHPELFNPDTHEFKPCLFGLHLLNIYKSKNIDQTVCIVESEKTALLMATAYGNHAKQVWMATGGLSYLNSDMLKPLIYQHRRIVLYPDRDGVEAWSQKAEQLHYDRVTIDTTPVLKWWRPEDGEKADIADVVVRMINNSKPLTSIDDVKAAMPETSPLIDKLNLTIEDNDRESKE